jgi:hypothetical protein
MSRDTFLQTATDFWEDHPNHDPGISVQACSSQVAIRIISDIENRAGALLTLEQVDELIRALAAARVEISNASPR